MPQTWTRGYSCRFDLEPGGRVTPSDGADPARRLPFSGRIESLGWRRDLGNEVANPRFVAQWLERHFTRFEASGAGVGGLAVDQDDAFLAGIGVDAGVAHRERRVHLGAERPQAVEHRLPRLVRHGVGLEPARLAR